MKVVLFVNDSYFSYLLARPLFEKFHDQIQAVVISTKIKGSASKVVGIFRKTHWRYFVYRLTIELINRINTLFRRRYVSALIRAYNLKVISTDNVTCCEELKSLLPADLGVAFNFDQILKGTVLGAFTHGVINVHSSYLPKDKGVSPVLWAFARGDSSIWSTIYRMDEGLDSGPIFRQLEIPVESDDTACSLYQRVCAKSGKELASVVDQVQSAMAHPQSQPEDLDAKTWSWPDQTHRQMMVESRRKLINLSDICQMLCKSA